MRKSLIAIAVAVLLLVGAGFFERYFVEAQFSQFGEELQTLYRKTDEGVANAEDAKAVQISWERRKERLHVWIPHNDVARMDETVAETVRLVGEGQFPLALAKIELLLHLAECLPGTYKPALENVLSALPRKTNASGAD